jgi:hypothetical protein
MFRCKIDEGQYSGIVEVSVDADLIERIGNTAIEQAAWSAWRKQFGPGLGMAYTACKILEEVY